MMMIHRNINIVQCRPYTASTNAAASNKSVKKKSKKKRRKKKLIPPVKEAKFYEKPSFVMSIIGGLIFTYFYRSGEGADDEERVMKDIKSNRALAPDEIQRLRAANYEFTLDEYEKLSKLAIETFPNKKVTKDEWEIFLKVAPTDFQPNFGDSQSNMLYNQSRGGLYKGDMPIFYYHYIERIFDKLETIYKQKNEGGDNSKSGDIPLDLMDVLFATALAISPSESLIKRATGIFDVALLLTDDNDLGNDEDANINNDNNENDTNGGIDERINVENIPMIIESLKNTDQIPARKLIRLKKKWFLPEYENISGIDFAKKLMLDKTDQKELDDWPLYPTIQVAEDYGSSPPKRFISGTLESLQNEFMEMKNNIFKTSSNDDDDVVGKNNNNKSSIIQKEQQQQKIHLGDRRTLSFNEFTCMLRTRQLCLWEMCRKTGRVGAGGGSGKDKKDLENETSDLTQDSPVTAKAIEKQQQLMEEMEKVNVEFIPATEFEGPKEYYVFKQDAQGLGYYTDRYSITLKRIDDPSFTTESYYNPYSKTNNNLSPEEQLKLEMEQIEEEFIPATKFDGPKENYVFKYDKKGLGYYTDRYEVALQRVNGREKRA